MQGDKLYDIADFILNEATESDLEVVRAALKRRIEGNRMRGAMGIDPGRMARQTASSIREQFGLSSDQIRSMVRDFAAEIIRKNAPELGEGQVDELLASWVSGDRAAAPGSAGGENAESTSDEPPQAATPNAGGKRRGAHRLAPEVVLTMVTQFISYSTDAMSVEQQIKLNEEIPDWQRKYWEQFSPRIRQLVKLYLDGEIDKETCLERVCAELGIEPS